MSTTEGIWYDGTMIVRVKVKPDARREEFEEIRKGVFVAEIKEPARNNAANTRVRELLARHFRVPKGQVRMRTGAHSGSKTFDVIQ